MNIFFERQIALYINIKSQQETGKLQNKKQDNKNRKTGQLHQIRHIKRQPVLPARLVQFRPIAYPNIRVLFYKVHRLHNRNKAVVENLRISRAPNRSNTDQVNNSFPNPTTRALFDVSKKIRKRVTLHRKPYANPSQHVPP
ncbi:hypothetical protein HanRHA438_Chr07g0320011 [Helianthus annuus]|nr:hypothetical protein HanRHA438_Chr07g0320011 [Helianthus annuus]